MNRRRPTGTPRPELGVAGVAQLAGVSTATVSNTINRPEMVAPATRARVLAAIEALDFVPNRAAGALRKGTSHLIGLVLPDIVNPFYAEIARAVGQAAAARGYAISLCASDDDPEQERKHFGMLAELRAAGAIVIPLNADDARLERLRLVGSHVVLVDRTWPTEEGCSVAIDDVTGGRLAAEHLIRTVGGPITIVNGQRSIPQCADREAGARAALADRGMNPDSLEVATVSEMTIGQGQWAVQRLIESGRPRAIFCTNDQLAVGVIRGAVAAGLRVPDDLVVVGYGDLPLSRDSILPITSVRQPKEQLGRTAVDLFVAEIDAARGGKSAPDHDHVAIKLEPELVVRGSAPG